MSGIQFRSIGPSAESIESVAPSMQFQLRFANFKMPEHSADKARQRIFVLSPARTDGKRAEILLREAARFDLAKRLRANAGVTIGEAFTFMSGLYFRGKLAYSTAFGRSVPGLAPSYVITSSSGLLPSNAVISVSLMRRFAEVPIDPKDERYRLPLRHSAREIASRLPAGHDVVLLGSIATRKYSDVLLEYFGVRLLFPVDFIGRGDMSRGGLLLRAVESGTELRYAPLMSVEKRTGKRPPRLK